MGGAETLSPSVTFAAEQQQKVYFGVGCFWRVQHEFVEKEKSALGRKDNELTVSMLFACSVLQGYQR